MGNIQIEKINEVHLRIFTEPSIVEEISEYFTFLAPNHQWHPSFKKRWWDGKIRLFQKRSKLLPCGLLRYLLEFAKERGYTVEGDLYVAENHSLKESETFLGLLKLQSRGKPLIPREDQISAVTKALRYRSCILLSATSSGKSLIIYSVIRFLLGMKKASRVLLIVPTTSLVEQMYSDFEDYSVLNGWKVERHCQKIYSGFTKEVSKSITISTWQSIYELPKEYFAQFDAVIGDEAHHFEAKSLGGIMDSLVNAKYRIGTTGTVDDGLVHKLALEGHFGPITKIISASELMELGAAAQLTIKCLVLKYPQPDREFVKKMEYPDEIEYLTQHQVRTNFISYLALSMKKNTLILFQHIDKHGKLLMESLTEKNTDHNRKIFFVHGGVDVEDRERIRAITESEENAIIVASYGVFSTGVNIKNLHNVFFASPSKSKKRVLQSIGRGLRLTDGKDSVTLYDIVDDLSLENHINYAMRHYVLRVKIYHEERFVVKTYYVGL